MEIIARSAQQLGAALRRHRSHRRLTQADVARSAGLGQPTVSEVESGSPHSRLKTLEALLAALELELVVRPRSSASPDDLARIY